jgi:hypothetical protein
MTDHQAASRCSSQAEHLFVERLFGVPIGQTALQFFTASYPQPLSTATACPVDSPQRGRASRPPIVESSAGGPYTPAQKIFAKVKAVIWPLTCGYSKCNQRHIRETGIDLNFLPYI